MDTPTQQSFLLKQSRQEKQMNLISDKFELKDLPERRQRRQRRRRWELWKLLKLSPLTTYLLPSHLLVYGKAATNYNKIVISFNLSAAAERTKFLFMFCHLVVLGSWFCRLPPAPSPFCSRNFFFARFRFRSPLPRSSSRSTCPIDAIAFVLEHCQRSMHLTFIGQGGGTNAEMHL